VFWHLRGAPGQGAAGTAHCAPVLVARGFEDGCPGVCAIVAEVLAEERAFGGRLFEFGESLGWDEAVETCVTVAKIDVQALAIQIVGLAGQGG
jgi:hypothetical protein